MSTSQATMDFLLDQLNAVGPITARKMFGEYCLYYDGRPVGLVCNDQLFLKPTEAGLALIAAPVYGPPYPGAKPHVLLTADTWEDGPWLGAVVRGTALALPMPRPKAAKSTHKTPKRAPMQHP